MDCFDPRITALEALKPKVIAARDRFAEFSKRLAEADGEPNSSLRDIVKELGEGMLSDLEGEVPEDALDELVSAEAGFKERTMRSRHRSPGRSARQSSAPCNP